MRKEIKESFGKIESLIKSLAPDAHIIEKLGEVLSEIEEEVDEMEAEIVDLKDQLSDLEGKNDDLEIELKNASNDRDTFEADLCDMDLPTLTLHDQMKNKILSNMAKNLSLEQLEFTEKQAKEMVRIYVTLD